MAEKLEFLRGKHEGILKLGKKKFILDKETLQKKNKEHISKAIFVEVDEKKHRERLKRMAKEIVAKGDVSAEEIIAASLEYLPLNELGKVETQLRKVKKVKKVRGCFALRIGNAEIEILE